MTIVRFDPYNQNQLDMELQMAGPEDVEDLILLEGMLRAELRQTWATSNRGVAIASNQVLHAPQLRAYYYMDELVVNPEFIGVGQAIYKVEGCLSHQSQHLVLRHNRGLLKYTVVKEGKFVRRKRKLQGLDAQVAQHEIEHLDGMGIWTRGTKLKPFAGPDPDVELNEELIEDV